MTQIEVSAAELALLQNILHQAQNHDIPQTAIDEQQEYIPEDFSSSCDTMFRDLDIDLTIAGFNAFSLGLSSREKKREKAPQREETPTDGCTWLASSPFPYKTLLLCLAVIVAIYWVATLTPAVVSHAAPTRLTHYAVKQQQQAPIVRSSSDSVVRGPTITESFSEHTLCAYNTNLCGTGQTLYDLGVTYHVDPAFALAFFWHESNFGTQGMATVDKSLGNLRCIDNELACNNGYAQFATWQDGYSAWFQLIAGPLYVGDGLTTVSQIIPRYAPTGDNNDEAAYIASVQASVAMYRAQGGRS